MTELKSMKSSGLQSSGERIRVADRSQVPVESSRFQAKRGRQVVFIRAKIRKHDIGELPTGPGAFHHDLKRVAIVVGDPHTNSVK